MLQLSLNISLLFYFTGPFGPFRVKAALTTSPFIYSKVPFSIKRLDATANLLASFVFSPLLILLNDSD